MDERNTIISDIRIPASMDEGTEFIKVNSRKTGTKTRVLKFDSKLHRITFKSKNLGVIQLEWITKIEYGKSITNFPNTNVGENEELRLNIQYSLKHKDKNLFLIAPNKVICQQWYDTLMLLTNVSIKDNLNDKEDVTVDAKLELWLKKNWAVVDKDKDGNIDFKEFKYFLTLINIDTTEQESKVLFKRIDTDNFGYLDFEGTKKMYYILQTRPEIQKLHSSLSKQNEGYGITYEEFKKFILEIQNEKLTEEQLHQLYLKYSNNNQYGINKDNFIHFLNSEDNLPIEPLINQPLHDMDQPLSHYWIKSSHNTYLTGNQLNSQSSISMYKDVLLKGCRCVELDCWDGPNNEPVIYHGYTLTSKILFKDVIQTIKDNAFGSSPYPVILSLEVHCSINQQDIMAQHLKDILGDILVATRFEDLNSDLENLRLPTPNQLLYKIILKGKALSSNSSKSFSELKKTDNEIVPLNNEPIIKEMITEEIPSAEESSGGESPKKTTHKVSKLLSDITPYCQTGKFVNYEHSKVNMKYYQMSSFSEPSLYSTFENAGFLPKVINEFIQHNERCISRVYPAGIRINSNNYNPLPFWMAGFQLVALNYQTYDLGMLLNRCFFRRNRQLGYVLKPEFMRKKQVKIPLPLPKKYYLHVKILSAQNLPKPNDDNNGEIIDPFVEIEMISVEYGTKFKKGTNQMLEPIQGVCNMREELVSSNANLDELSLVVVRKSQRTDVVTDNGFNPTFNSHTVFMFSDLEYSFLRFTIHEFNKRTTNGKIGQYCIRASDLKLGYRHIPVQDFNGKEFPMASLFIYTALEEHDDPNVLLRGMGGNKPMEDPAFKQPIEDIKHQLNRLTLKDFPVDQQTIIVDENGLVLSDNVQVNV